MIVSLTESNAPQEVTPRLAEEIRRSKALTTVHTGRILKVLRTQLIAFHKSPIGQSIDLYQPDTDRCIDLDSLSLIKKRPEVKGWSDMAWTYRWSIPAITKQLDYQNYHKINIEKELENLLIDIPHVWLPTSKNGIGKAFRLDIFISVNTPSTNTDLDAAYFNINTGWIEYLINDPNAAFAYPQQLTKNLPKNADILADYFLRHFSPDEHETPIEKKESWYKMVPKPAKMPWKEYAANYIRKPLVEVKKALRLSKLELKTNGLRGDNMLTWLEYSVNDNQPLPLYSLPEEAPQRTIVAEPFSTKQVSSTGQHKLTWKEVINSDDFSELSIKIISKCGIPDDKLACCVSLYGERAVKQKPKSLKSWLWPFERWLKANRELFVLDEKPATVIPKETSQPNNSKKAIIKLNFTPELVTEDLVEKIAHDLIQGADNQFASNDQVKFFVEWNIKRFQSYHSNHGTPSKTFAQWHAMFSGWVINASTKESALKAFFNIKFEPFMILEEEPFKKLLTSLDNYYSGKGLLEVVRYSLSFFADAHKGSMKSVVRWQTIAWKWLQNEETIKNLGITIPNINRSLADSE